MDVYQRKYYDENWLREEYVEKNRTAKDIADECGVKTSTIEGFVSKNGFQKNPPDSADYKQRKWLQKHYRDRDMSMSEVARASEYDIKPSTVRYWLKKRDLLRPEW